MQIASGESFFGCSNGIHNDLAPIDGAPGSAGSSLAEFFLMISSHDGSPQNGARINYKINELNLHAAVNMCTSWLMYYSTFFLSSSTQNKSQLSTTTR